MKNIYENVSAVVCGSYERDTVHTAMEELIRDAGGLDWVTPGMRIGVKLNLCAAKKPETAAVTHFALAAELTRMLAEREACVVLGDSPGGTFNRPFLQRVYEASGMDSCREANGELNADFGTVTVAFPEGESVREYACCRWLTECDAVISFCKLKSHGLMGMTAAVKNIYGIIPGTMKSEYHYMHTDPYDFANMLVDLNESLKPRLFLCDAVEIMEGNGPTMGTPRPFGLLLAGSSPYALDRVCAALLGIHESEIPYLQAAKDRGLLPEEGKVPQDFVRQYGITDFKRSGATASWFIQTPEDRGLRRLAKKGMYVLLRSRPSPSSACTGCGHCAENCPAQAITIKNRKARIDRKKCVRCFCCQEFCPSGAMKAQRSPVAKLMVR